MLDQMDLALSAALDAADYAEFERLATIADANQAARETRLSAPDILAATVGWYIRHGIAVFPLRPGDKRPHPGSRGFKDATTDPDQVTRWWTSNPQSNIGLPTGHGFDVIDIDGPAGYQSMADLREGGHLPPILARVATPRGGMHLYIPPTGDGNAASFRPGLDYRGIGGYVVAPPSIVNGRRYDWLEPLTQPAAAA